MKTCILTFLTLVMTLAATGQSQDASPEISLGYMASLGFEPGTRVGLHLNYRSWNSEKNKGDKTLTRVHQLFVSPQFGAFTRPRTHTSYWIGAEGGYKVSAQGRRSYSAYSIGLAYLGRSEITSITVNFQGETTARERELQSHIVPTFNYEYGHRISNRLGAHLKLSYGWQFRPNHEKAGLFLPSVGLRYALGSASESNQE